MLQYVSELNLRPMQMEYVEKLTLREAIEDGISEVDAWRLMVSWIVCARESNGC